MGELKSRLVKQSHDWRIMVHKDAVKCARCGREVDHLQDLTSDGAEIRGSLCTPREEWYEETARP